ncbi:MAG TPA: choice-of-anchor Q domain-containing protein [Acidobacteriaceae bacterium]
MGFKRCALVSPVTGMRRSTVRAAAIAVAITLACFPAAPRAQAQTTTITVTNLNDSGTGSLRAAIAQSASTPTGQSTVINFASGVTGTIPLASTLSVCNGQALTIEGASQIHVSGQNTVQVFNICSGTAVTLSGLTIEKGLFPGGVGTGFDGGGGIENNAWLTVTNSTISGNAAGGQGVAVSIGGGIENNGTLTVTNSTFSGNTAGTTGLGGGINNIGILTVRNSTFSHNTAASGAGIYNFSKLIVTNSTFSGNAGTNGGGISDSAPDLSDSMLIKSTILAGNTGGNCFHSINLDSQGYNLSDDATCTIGVHGFTQPTDMNNTLAGLDPKGLQNNGGPTQTIALLPASPAVDAIPVANCTDTQGNPVTTDQRGVSRPQGKGCDIGAYELIQSVPFATFKAELAIFTQKPYGYALTAEFTPGTSSTGINPTTEGVTLQIATYTVTIPAGSFKQLWSGPRAPYAYAGTINGVATRVVITPLEDNRYGLIAAASPVDLPGAANPVTVMLTIGDNSGNTPVNAIRLH